MDQLCEQQTEFTPGGFLPRAVETSTAAPMVTVTVKTADKKATRIVVLPHTTVGEVMVRACRDLGVRDPKRWALVAAGEMTADAWPVGDLATRAALDMRLLRKPEAA